MPLQRLSREAIARGLQQNVTRSIAARLFHASAAVQADDQIECKVNGEPVRVPKGSTVMQACDAAGIDIPRQGLKTGVPVVTYRNVLAQHSRLYALQVLLPFQIVNRRQL